jgi:outer membrane lipase/esterase
MIKRLLGALALVTLLLGAASPDAWAEGGSGSKFKSIYVFGDSLSDTGNLFGMTGGFEPPSPPYFAGRFSNGPIWVEVFDQLLDPKRDFDTTPVVIKPLANNQAVGGAFTDTRGEVLPGSGVLSQVANFAAAGGKIKHRDLVVVWAGANNYLGGDIDPFLVVDDLVTAVQELYDLGARWFLVPNLPNLGDTPLGGLVLDPEEAAGLNALTAGHNAILAGAMAALSAELGVDIVIVDINAMFQAILTEPAAYGFANVTVPCLIQQPDGSRVPSGACPPDGDTYDATGVLFWDLIHPTAAGHALVAMVARTTLSASTTLMVAAGE